MLQAQTPQRCNSHEYHQHQLAQHPELADTEAEINRAAEHFANNGGQPRLLINNIGTYGTGGVLIGAGLLGLFVTLKAKSE